MFRVGHGFDVHRTADHRPLVLGGVPVPCTFGLLGHSDADVLLHAVTDAVLGALALGDIGQWFPDTDPQFAGISSVILLQQVLDDDRVRTWELMNLDCTIFAETPRLAVHVPAIRQSIADVFAVNVELVSVKATTTEKLGFVGRGEGLAAEAVVMMRRRS